MIIAKHVQIEDHYFNEERNRIMTLNCHVNRVHTTWTFFYQIKHNQGPYNPFKRILVILCIG